MLLQAFALGDIPANTQHFDRLTILKDQLGAQFECRPSPSLGNDVYLITRLLQRPDIASPLFWEDVYGKIPPKTDTSRVLEVKSCYRWLKFPTSYSIMPLFLPRCFHLKPFTSSSAISVA